MDSDNAERSSAPCTVAGDELIMDLGLRNSKGKRAPVPEFSPEKATVPPSGPERAPIPDISPERALVSTSSPERAPVTEFRPE